MKRKGLLKAKRMTGIHSIRIRSERQVDKYRSGSDKGNYRIEIKTNKDQNIVSGFLYSSEDEALQDADCFEWYHSNYGKNIHRPQMNKKKWDWKTHKPIGEDWDTAREFILDDWRSTELKQTDPNKLGKSQKNEIKKKIYIGQEKLVREIFPNRDLTSDEIIEIVLNWIVLPNSPTQQIGDAFFKVLTFALDQRAKKSGNNDEVLLSLLSVPLLAGMNLSKLNEVRFNRSESEIGRRIFCRAFHHIHSKGYGAPVVKRIPARKGLAHKNEVTVRFSDFVKDIVRVIDCLIDSNDEEVENEEEMNEMEEEEDRKKAVGCNKGCYCLNCNYDDFDYNDEVEEIV